MNKKIINEETVSGDIAPVDKRLDNNIDRRGKPYKTVKSGSYKKYILDDDSEDKYKKEMKG